MATSPIAGIIQNDKPFTAEQVAAIKAQRALNPVVGTYQPQVPTNPGAFVNNFTPTPQPTQPIVQPSVNNTPVNTTTVTNGAPNNSGTTNGQTIVQPWQKSDSSINRGYVPTSLSDEAYSKAGVDKYTANQWTINYLNSHGIQFNQNQYPTSPEDEFRIQGGRNEADKSYLDKQLDFATQKSREQTQGAISGTQGTIGAVNREGLVSQSNQTVAQQTVDRYRADQNNLEAQYQHSKDMLQRAIDNNDKGAIEGLTQQVQATQQKLLETANKNIEDTSAFVSQLRENAKEGIVMSPAQMAQYAQKYNIPADGLLAFNAAAEKINKTKGLDDQQKQAALDQAAQNLKDQVAGIRTEKAKDVAYYQTQVKAILNDPSLTPAQRQQQIAIAAERMDIKSSENPFYVTEQNYKNAQIAYQNSNTAKNYQDLLDAEEAHNAIYGDNAYVPPLGSNKYSISTTVTPDGKQSVSVGVKDGQSLDIPGTSRREDWCAAFVNDAMGTKFGDLFTQKVGMINTHVPAPGMAFVEETADKFGHVGIVESVDLANGKMNVVEANWQKGSDGKGIVSRRTMNIADANGFVKPQSSVAVKDGQSPTQTLLSVPKELRGAVTQKASQFDGEGQVKTFQTLQVMKNKADSVSNTTSNPQDDQLLVYTYAKAMDPASSVREGEYDSVQKYAQTGLERFGVNAQRFYSNKPFLTPEARANIKKSITSAYKSEEQSYDQTRSQYIKSIDALAGKNIGSSILQDYKIPQSDKQSNGDPLNLGVNQAGSDPLGLFK